MLCSVVLGGPVVFWRKWAALRSKLDFYPLREGGDLLSAGSGATLKGEDSPLFIIYRTALQSLYCIFAEQGNKQ